MDSLDWRLAREEIAARLLTASLAMVECRRESALNGLEGAALVVPLELRPGTANLHVESRGAALGLRTTAAIALQLYSTGNVDAALALVRETLERI